ncbi:MAG: sodium:proton antiporter NhaD [Bacteroidetes Order II. Incertae sedis bacterium]|nr:sodium:proton antiporter NhaD [Bacteroidetes Order II. bacterium]
MESLLVGIFIIGYAAIAFEHPIKINKSATALLTGVLLWTVVVLTSGEVHHIETELGHHLADIAQILFFLLGAMTIVELVDAHEGFRMITDRIRTQDVRKLLWLISWVTFFLSAILDNLTTAIVMVSLLRKLIKNHEMRKMFAGMVVIAANAGGAFSPIGDVTTTMLWIGGQISTVNIILSLFIPSVICLLVPLIWIGFHLKGTVEAPAKPAKDHIPDGSTLMLILGVGGLVFVPIFKTVTHLPPYVGMLLSLSVIWIASELLHKNKDEEVRKPYTASEALKRVDTPSILFFLGILLAISALEVSGILGATAQWLNDTVGNLDVIAVVIGLLSAIVDNVPLVAATMGMYDLATYPMDSKIWEFIAYTAGTGGSILIIGSAAGVAVMGMEKIDFIWYVKKISIWAAIGYFAGAAAYIVIYALLHTH